MPGLTASTELKERLGALTLRKIEKAREAAIAATFASAGVTLAVVLALLWLGLTFRRRLFLPLISVREEILSLSVGGLGNPPSRAKAGPEVDEMFAGLAVLRDELRRKQVLERERRRTNQHLKRLAETDSLTGLLNRRAAAEQAPGVIEAARQAGQPLGAILLDIDHFKTVNDVYGHAGGDTVLKRVAAVLTSLARPAISWCATAARNSSSSPPGSTRPRPPIWPNGCACASRPDRGIARPFRRHRQLRRGRPRDAVRPRLGGPRRPRRRGPLPGQAPRPEPRVHRHLPAGGRPPDDASTGVKDLPAVLRRRSAGRWRSSR